MGAENLSAVQSARLRWACRRGMLELDLILQHFLEAQFAQLKLDEQQDFTDLLNCTDPELFAWLIGKEEPTEPKFQTIVRLIRHYAQPAVCA